MLRFRILHLTPLQRIHIKMQFIKQLIRHQINKSCIQITSVSQSIRHIKCFRVFYISREYIEEWFVQMGIIYYLFFLWFWGKGFLLFLLGFGWFVLFRGGYKCTFFTFWIWLFFIFYVLLLFLGFFFFFFYLLLLLFSNLSLNLLPLLLNLFIQLFIIRIPISLQPL